MSGQDWDKERFKDNPSRFIERAIKQWVADDDGNRLSSFNREPIFDEPLVGFANGDDPIFEDYKSIINEYHLTPREAFREHLKERGIEGGEEPGSITVIPFVLPVTQATRQSMHQETIVPSLRWNHTRWHGQELIYELSHRLVSLLEEGGYRAFVPEKGSFYRMFFDRDGRRVSNWSLRHFAYAAGLGTFSLNDAFITPRGIAIRLGCVVSDIALEPTPRIYKNHVANCLFHADGSCRRCMERCPAGAISEQGHDKIKCREYLFTGEAVALKALGRDEGYMGSYHGCGLCQTKVPCEAGIPPKAQTAKI